MKSYSNKQQEDGLNKLIEFNKQRIQRLEEIKEGVKTPFWKALKKDIDVSIESSQRQVNDLAEGRIEFETGRGAHDFQSAVRFWGGQLRAYRGVIADVEKAEDKIAALNEEIRQAQGYIHKLRNEDSANELMGSTPGGRNV